MRRVLLVGNPNVGKSVLFSRLTGVHAIASNYPGTTVGYTRGRLKYGTEEAEVVDVPGTLSLEPGCEAEDVACRMIAGGGDVIINVLDATNLERNLYLTLQLQEMGLPMVVALNMWDETRHRGVEIDVDGLSQVLGVPVVPTVATTGQGLKRLVEALRRARSPEVLARSPEVRWRELGAIVRSCQIVRHHHHTALQRLEDVAVHPVLGIIMAAVVLGACFWIIRTLGEGVIAFVSEPLFDKVLAPGAELLSRTLGGAGLLHHLLLGRLIDGRVDFEQSFGLLTTGLFVPLGVVLPYVVAFYLALSFLEDVGYLPRLAVLVDNVMHRLGLHGYAIIPTLLGLGCNVPAILATRILESRRQRFVAATLISIGVPCAALQAMVVALLGPHGLRYIAVVYLTLFISWVLLGLALRVLAPGIGHELLVEIPPFRYPPVGVFLKKFRMRVGGFVREALPMVFLGVLVVNILTYFHLFEAISRLAAPVLQGLLGLPPEAALAIVLGLLRKDIAVGMLAGLGLSVAQLVVGSVVLAMFFPCVATFVVLFRELGPVGLLKSALIMVVAALAAGSVLNLLF
jgi:ferrous iron transport protein B